MSIREFQLERYFAQWEFEVPYLLSASDCETMSIGELLALAATVHGTRQLVLYDINQSAGADLDWREVVGISSGAGTSYVISDLDGSDTIVSVGGRAMANQSISRPG